MIISASYKTDIPAFYGEWFMNRLRAGYCKMINPWNRNQRIHVPLELPNVDGIVFWTKNIGPFMRHLPEVRDRGYPFVIQYTINGYPKSLEHSVVDAKRSVEHFQQVSQDYGAKSCVWRYDTVVISSNTPVDFHLQNFETLCRDLADTTDEVVVSFLQLYKKTIHNMDLAAKEFDFDWEDPSTEVKRKIATTMAEMASSHGMQLTMCSQPDYVVPNVKEARCIDAARLEEVAGKPIVAQLGGGRKECGCFAARDIGDYDTCPHGCVYCYAVRNRALALRRYQRHDPTSEFLFSEAATANGDDQLSLFEK